jgi:formylglycine-generating enzyme required for sulfatase activity
MSQERSVSKRAYLTKLRELLVERFGEDDLVTLCFDLGIDYADLPNPGRRNKARDLVRYVDRHDRVSELVECGRRLRPDISWDDLPELAEGKADQSGRLITRPETAEKQLPHQPEVILIPAGLFFMGSDPQRDHNANDDEQPQFTLYLPDYYMSKTPVTNAQYAAFVEETGCDPPDNWVNRKPPRGKEDHPVVHVSWYAALEYCHWLSGVTGRHYCLPSEAEWEKGARGDRGWIYPWGNRWYKNRCNVREVGELDTKPVDAYPKGASVYGLLDMAGNVWEWTRSLWGEISREAGFKYPYDIHDIEDERENLDAPETMLRVLRSCPYFHRRKSARCAFRDRRSPSSQNIATGFRVVAVSI